MRAGGVPAFAMPPPVALSRKQIHTIAVKAVIAELQAQGFGTAAFRNDPGEKVRVMSFEDQPLSIPIVYLQVHGSTQPPSEAVLADERPIADKREMVVCCWLDRPPRFLFLTNAEARELWHKGGARAERAFYGTHEAPLVPDTLSIQKLLRI